MKDISPPHPRQAGRSAHPDVIIVGGGIVGLTSAAALARRHANVLLLAQRRAGEASPAAAGMLAPGVESGEARAHRFAVAARDRYPGIIEELAEATGIQVPLNRKGILELVQGDGDAERVAGDLPAGADWVGRAELHALEPQLARAAGAILYPNDGAVDNVALIDALRASAQREERITLRPECATAIRLGGHDCAVVTASGAEYRAPTLVLAAGAWSATLDGLPRPLPVVPIRGQMYSVSAVPLAHVTYGPRGYVVPRGDGTTVVGATMEDAGFDVSTTPEGMARVQAGGEEIVPALAAAPVRSRWSGFRPVTPDLLPILGPDPEYPSLLYACGHSRNGILLGPLSGDCVAELALDGKCRHDISPFSISRFAT
ncbi:MAG TPA: FAD-dependent oxidoreductase [Gemmatimonadaceae bacterium]|nr:FAD-dependent oxidoreductase [Gemmatimonadaceae bacterium]